MKKIIFALSISLLVGAGLFLSASSNSKTIDLAKSNLEATGVSAGGILECMPDSGTCEVVINGITYNQQGTFVGIN